MKIKAVCEITGLTSRAIRVYIEEKLISPSFTENYLGRRSFDFSDDDAERLKSIAILRKNGFSIDEIRAIINDSGKSIEIVKAVKNRISKQAEEYRLRLQAFSQIDSQRAYTVSELAQALSQISIGTPPPNESPKISAGQGLKLIAVFVAVWSPFFISLFSFLVEITNYAYPKFDLNFIPLTFLTLLPSISILVISKIRLDHKKIIKRIILGLCIIAIPFSFILPLGIVTGSETTDLRNYRDFDPGCLANRNVVFQELFPNWPHYFENVKSESGHFETVYTDAKYYYQYFQGLDYTYDIFAEWPLEDNEFALEVQRAKQVFKKANENQTYNYRYAEIEKGNFTCLILYSGDEPFRNATDNYQYVIFAYDDARQIVRYVFCDSLENGAEQPFYLQLEW